MKATVLLADATSPDPGGKVHALGLGWTMITVPTGPVSVIVLLDVGWDETNRQIQIDCKLLDGDGRAVMQQTPLGEIPIGFGGQIEVGRPPGTPPGTPIRTPIAVNLPPGSLPLVAGQRYTWQVEIDGTIDNAWSESFLAVAGQVQNPPQMPQG